MTYLNKSLKDKELNYCKWLLAHLCLYDLDFIVGLHLRDVNLERVRHNDL